MGQLFPGAFNPYKPLGFASIDVTAVEPLAVPANAKGALVQANGGNINWRDDGVSPTSEAGQGFVLVADAEPTWMPVNQAKDSQFIAQGDSTLLLVSYYG